MRQCRKHGTRLEDGLRVGHHWVIVPVETVQHRKDGTTRTVVYHYGECKHCNKRKRFHGKPTARVRG